MLFGLLFLGMVPAVFLADGFMDGRDEVEPDEGQDSPSDDLPPGNGTGDNGTGDFLSPPDTSTDDPDTSTDDTADPDDVLNPIDQPGEGAPGGSDATLLDGLLGKNCDAIYGLPDYQHVMGETDPMLLGDGDDSYTGTSDGIKADAALKLFNGTPFVEMEEDGLVGVIDGQGGDDTITTGDNASFAFGGEGDDKITVGAAPAAVFGGEGDDEIIGAYTAASDEYSGYLDGGIGNDLVRGGEGIDLIFGGQHDDNGEGPDDDTLSGGAGDDQINGGYGADVIAGDEGNDVLNHLGHAMEQSGAERSSFDWHIDNEADTLDGGEGDDTIIFDRADTATGGVGADNFHLYFDDDSGEGHADVTDFVPGEDFLKVTLDPDEDPDDVTLEVKASEDGADGVVVVNGEIIAVLEGAPDATSADVYVEVAQDIYT
ncbi:calcium-binding protein [Aliiroseovarius lamellibrachiae]|uniref:calcium-binding protein n=1 Tax=Aliiroseovarius lamellibrachiae TaxID=1924933 RepID=UPI001BDFF969|nr:hypothetical protein [Aliiroseovarius lamellibrachiae]MBT2131558.1 hypothetical protein [Aliiroseovarius lamellibrachiae]